MSLIARQAGVDAGVLEPLRVVDDVVVKPFILMEAFSDCGERLPLYPASRVADKPLTLKLPSGNWSPGNYDGKYLGAKLSDWVAEQTRDLPAEKVPEFAGEFGEQLLDALAVEIDRIEEALRAKFPRLVYVDLESDDEENTEADN